MLQLKTKQVSYFLYWIKERHNIYLKRMAGEPKPWTDDYIFQNYFFTNPYRENDKTTRWFREMVRDPLRNNPKVLMATVIFRRFNYIPTGQILRENLLLEFWDSKVAMNVLEDETKVFTGAFMISSPNHKPKLPEVCRMIDAQWNRRKSLIASMIVVDSLKRAWKLLQSEHHKGLMPYEVVTDLRHTFFLRDAHDVDKWAYFGPGGQRGVARILGVQVKGAIPNMVDQETCLEVGEQLLEITRNSLPDLPHFEMREIEHSLCEYAKYMAINEGGRAKRRFEGGSLHG